MSNAKACIVFTIGLEKEVPAISTQLSDEGFNVCTAAADQDIVEAAQSGSLSIPEAVKSCIDNAEICIFLIPKEESEGTMTAAGYAGNLGNKIVAVVEDINSLPQIFDDLATSVVCIGSPQLPDALKGKSVWESPNGSEAGKRKIDRVRCQ
ncbi:hypothetical protein [Pseudomonas capsici]|uniref:hypothetical protein n=1 Tax=Pseudomonas capsici TaxID=2810614 RepID=UPI000E3D850D|nr:hypothetical protein [Pseudomonas capsici]MCV4261429.1 nucleoside 2-deoxyribosyltransferase [Pseudomonas capsici]